MVYGIAWLLLLSLFSSQLPAQSAERLSAYEVIKRGEKQMRGLSSYARVRIDIKKRRFQRSMLIDTWETKSGERNFIRILKPKKDRGVTFLKLSQNLWQYIPKIGKEIKIEESLLGESWMGSDFTNDDLVKNFSIVDDYNHAFLPTEDKRLYKIGLTAKPGRPVVWNKIIIYSRRKDWLPEKEEFFDHKGRLKKRMTLSQFRVMGGRLIPTRLEMATLKDNRPQSRTVMNYNKIKFDLQISTSIFTKANLRR